MKYLFFIPLIISISVIAGEVKDDSCKVPQSSIGIALMQEMESKLKIDPASIIEEKTKTELIANYEVDSVLAEQFAKEDHKEISWVPIKEYKKIYIEDNVRNLIIKFTFENKEKKQAVFLASALVNDYECSVRFNGYMVVKREF